MAEYVYKKTEAQLWTVGFYQPDGLWIPESDHDTMQGAVDRVHFLNGGCSREAVYLTVRQQNMLAGLAETLRESVRKIIAGCGEDHYIHESMDLEHDLQEWILRFTVTPQDMDEIYDLMHRSGKNL